MFRKYISCLGHLKRKHITCLGHLKKKHIYCLGQLKNISCPKKDLANLLILLQSFPIEDLKHHPPTKE